MRSAYCFRLLTALVIWACHLALSHTHAQSIECEYDDFLWEINTNIQTTIPMFGYGLHLDGTRLYSTHRLRLNIYDLTDKNTPVLLSSTANTSNYRFEDFDIAGNYLYVISGTGQFSVFNIADPSQPQLVEHHNTGSSLSSVCTNGPLLMTIDLNDVLRIYELDSSNGTAHFQGQVTLQHQAHSWTRISAQNGLVFVVTDYGYECFDVSDPSAPTLVATFSSPTYTTDSVLNGSFLYIATGSGVQTVDISNPSLPSLVHNSNDGVSLSRITINGNLLCGSSYDRGVYTYDISNPAQPTLKGARRPTTQTTDVQIAGSTCYALGTDRIVAIDVSSDRPSALLSEVKLRPNGGGPTTLHHSGGWLYEINEIPITTRSSFNQISVARVNDPTDPQFLGIHTLNRDSYGFAAMNNVVFYANQLEGLVATDMTDPTAPVSLDQLDINATPHDMYIQDGILYAHTYNRLLVVDVSDPGSMALLSDYQVIQEHELMGFTLKDNHIIFVTSHSELIIVNVSDPSQPSVEWVHTHPPPAYYHHHRIHMSVDDDLLVYSSDSTDYNFLDVSDLSNVAWLQTVSPQGHAAKPILRNGRAYLYDEFLGLEIYDITDPTNIFRIGLSGARHSTYGFTFLDDEICVIGGNIYGCDIVRTGSDCSSACPADANHDGSLSPADFSAWVAAFNTHAPECDQNNDGSCTPADFSAWVANYNAGC